MSEQTVLLTDATIPGHERVIKLIIDQDELTWQGLLQELVRTHQMDPWDIDVSKLARSYIQTIKQLKELDFRLTGKIVLASAILLKIKSNRLIGEDLAYFDQLVKEPEEEDLDLFDDEVPRQLSDEEKPKLIPRTPQPRKRKVSIHDLVEALEQALEVKRRRILLEVPRLQLEIPKKSKDIGKLIHSVFDRIKAFFSSGKKEVTFTELSGPTKEDKVHTFIPLLHLTNERKIDLRQTEHFGEINITLRDRE